MLARRSSAPSNMSQLASVFMANSGVVVNSSGGTPKVASVFRGPGGLLGDTSYPIQFTSGVAYSFTTEITLSGSNVTTRMQIPALSIDESVTDTQQGSGSWYLAFGGMWVAASSGAVFNVSNLEILGSALPSACLPVSNQIMPNASGKISQFTLSKKNLTLAEAKRFHNMVRNS